MARFAEVRYDLTFDPQRGNKDFATNAAHGIKALEKLNPFFSGAQFDVVVRPGYPVEKHIHDLHVDRIHTPKNIPTLFAELEISNYSAEKSEDVVALWKASGDFFKVLQRNIPSAHESVSKHRSKIRMPSPRKVAEFIEAFPKLSDTIQLRNVFMTYDRIPVELLGRHQYGAPLGTLRARFYDE